MPLLLDRVSGPLERAPVSGARAAQNGQCPLRNRSAGHWSPATWRTRGPRNAPARTVWPVSWSASLAARSRKTSRFGRQPVELLPQAGQRNHRHAAAQLRLPEDERQHRNEQVARPVTASSLRASAGQSRTSISSTGIGAVLPRAPGRRRNQSRAVRFPAPATSNSRARRGPIPANASRSAADHAPASRPRTGTSFFAARPPPAVRRAGAPLRPVPPAAPAAATR